MLALVPGILRVPDPTGRATILTNPADNRTVRVGNSMVTLLDRFAGSPLGEVVGALRTSGHQNADQLASAVVECANALQVNGLLVGSAPAAEPQQSLLLRRSVRLPILNFLRGIAFRLAYLLKPRARPRLAITGTLVVVVVALVAAVARVVDPGPLEVSSPNWFVVAGALAVQLAIHELAHTFAAAAWGLPVAEIGIRLKYGVLPMPYTLGPAPWTVPQRGRVVIALAGPAADVVVAGAAALLASVGGGIGAAFVVVTHGLLIIAVLDLVPTIGSDGLHAAEAVSGRTNVGEHALQATKATLLRRPLPAWLRGRTGAQIAKDIGLVAATIASRAVAGLVVAWALLGAWTP